MAVPTMLALPDRIAFPADGREISNARECTNTSYIYYLPIYTRVCVCVYVSVYVSVTLTLRARRPNRAMRVGRGAHRHKRASEKGSLFLI